jgi:hypothetical protein
MKFSRYDRIAVILCLAVFAAAAWISFKVYEAEPHIEDEMAYTWQAEAIAEIGRASCRERVCAYV